MTIDDHAEVRRMPDWAAAVWAGVLAGALFLVLEMLMVPAFLGGSAFGPPRMIAAIVMGRDVLPPPATFDIGVFGAALLVHFVLSILYTLVLSALISRVHFGVATAAGGMWGLFLFVVNFYAFTALFPWFATARNWVTVTVHLLFGLAAAGIYKAFERIRIRRRSVVRVGPADTMPD